MLIGLRLIKTARLPIGFGSLHDKRRSGRSSKKEKTWRFVLKKYERRRRGRKSRQRPVQAQNQSGGYFFCRRRKGWPVLRLIF